MRSGAYLRSLSAAALLFLPVLLGAGKSSDSSLPTDSDAEHDLVELVNHSREEAGLPKLPANEQLREAARAHARQMAARGRLSHRFAGEPELRLRVAATGVRFDFVGENVARGYSPAGLHQDFLLSPGHRENILEPRATAVGIGVVRTGDELWVAEEFAEVIPDLAPKEVEDLVAGRIAELRRLARLKRLPRGSPVTLREDACRMASLDRVQFTPRDGPPGATLRTVAYATADPSRYPDGLQGLATREKALSFAVGACSGRTPSYPSGAYWVVVVFYF